MLAKAHFGLMPIFSLLHMGGSVSLRSLDGIQAPASAPSPAADPGNAAGGVDGGVYGDGIAAAGLYGRHTPRLELFESWLADRARAEDAEDKALRTSSAAKEGPRMVVGVFSRAGNEDLPYRDAIRRSWMGRPGICAAEDWRPWSDECLVFASFVVGNNKPQPKEQGMTVLDVKENMNCGKTMVGNNKPQPKEQGMTVLDVKENMNCGKTMVWLQHAAKVFPWATHLIKMDMDTYPRFESVMHQLPGKGANCPNYYGGHQWVRPPHGCSARKPILPECHCGLPIGSDFTKYPSGDPTCWTYIIGGFSVLTRQLALEISRPGGWWEAAARGCWDEDATTGQAVHEYAVRTGDCVTTSNLTGIWHLR